MQSVARVLHFILVIFVTVVHDFVSDFWQN